MYVYSYIITVLAHPYTCTHIQPSIWNRASHTSAYVHTSYVRTNMSCTHFCNIITCNIEKAKCRRDCYWHMHECWHWNLVFILHVCACVFHLCACTCTSCAHDCPCLYMYMYRSPKEKAGVKRALEPGPSTPTKSPRRSPRKSQYTPPSQQQ